MNYAGVTWPGLTIRPHGTQKGFLTMMGEHKVLRRVLVVSLYSIGVFYFFDLIVMPIPLPVDARVVLVLYALGFNIASEGTIIIDWFLNRHLPWYTNGRLRLRVQLLATLAWVCVMTFVAFWSYVMSMNITFEDFHLRGFFLFSIFSGFLFLALYNGIEIGRNFFLNWRSSMLELERLKQEKLKSDYRLLQDQLNPHFLFNSLNVLISEISYSPPTAVEFTRRLSRVYRYVLQSRNRDVVPLAEELEFIESYVFLHKVRVEDALHLAIAVEETAKEKYLPPLTLQILVENALKHNVASQERPLRISVEARDAGTLCVTNTLEPKEAIDSTHTGLSNLRDRYALLGDRTIEVGKAGGLFRVTVPLLDK